MENAQVMDEKHLIGRGIAQNAQVDPPTDFAKQGLVKFLREQIVDAEWKIARAKAEISAYEQAVTAIEAQQTPGA